MRLLGIVDWKAGWVTGLFLLGVYISFSGLDFIGFIGSVGAVESEPTSDITGSYPSLLTEGLVIYLPFNGSALDESGNEHHGTIIGATPVPDRFGNSNSAYSFDGKNDKIIIESSSDFDLSELTISVWFKLTDYPSHNNNNYAPIISRWYDAGPVRVYWTLHVSNENLRFLIRRNDRDGNGFSPIYKLSLNQYYHAVVTFNSSKQARMYVDNILWADRPLPLTNLLTNVGQDIEIGYAAVGGGVMRYFAGHIDDIRIYNRVLSREEITELFLAEK